MLTGAIIIGALLGLLVQAGRMGFIPAWGEPETPAWARLMLMCQALALAYGYTETTRGFLIVGLSGLGSFTLARATLAALVEVARAIRRA